MQNQAFAKGLFYRFEVQISRRARLRALPPRPEPSSCSCVLNFLRDSGILPVSLMLFGFPKGHTVKAGITLAYCPSRSKLPVPITCAKNKLWCCLPAALLDLPIQPTTEVLGFGLCSSSSQHLPFRFYEQCRRGSSDPTVQRSVFASVDKVPGKPDLLLGAQAAFLLSLLGPSSQNPGCWNLWLHRPRAATPNTQSWLSLLRSVTWDAFPDIS